MRKPVIGIAAGRKYENYLKWIRQVPEIEIIKLGYEDNNFEQIKECQGVVLTGGEDVHPGFYKKPEYVEKHHLDDIDEARDEFELKIIDYTQREDLPLLGICRGLQIVNVFFGGTLVADIPSSGKPDHTKYEEGRDRMHRVRLVDGSLLRQVAGVAEGEVNSAHHQCVDTVSDVLSVNAISVDGIVEGLERKEKAGHPFLLAVQWHPERMIDQGSALSRNIRDRFIQSIKHKITGKHYANH